jgi:hypothetical protein
LAEYLGSIWAFFLTLRDHGGGDRQSFESATEEKRGEEENRERTEIKEGRRGEKREIKRGEENVERREQ